ncbi:hypothetical protein OOZ51_15580 [Arthrobacter sp. MI7-26]|uniref:hypothetical protein n=1 Tax=Arthrobacter sp. MI7-26 TaxID=2993653 RepID=UPI00224881B1|nr:hypothetical protein [Arthrobacter sp. MI7-26]MCX2749228.1 hypothetical protein [Arthrobacter sp. MI7-26]
MGSDSVPGRRFPDTPSYHVHRRVVETHARELPNSNSLVDALAKRTRRGGRKAEFEFTAASGEPDGLGCRAGAQDRSAGHPPDRHLAVPRRRGRRGTLAWLLASLKSGADQPVLAEDISGWIERFGIGLATPNEVKTGVYRFAVRHGGDFAAQIPRDLRTMRLANGLSRAAHGERRGLDFERYLILFGAEVLAWASPAKGLSALPGERDLMRLVDAGITAPQAAEGYLRGMSATQMIAVHRDGMVPGVPDG